MDLRKLQEAIMECEELNDKELVEYVAGHENQDPKFWTMVVLNLRKSQSSDTGKIHCPFRRPDV